MGIRFYCPNGHKLNVKEFQAGRRGICPYCGAKIQIPLQSTRPSSRDELRAAAAMGGTIAGVQLPSGAQRTGVPTGMPTVGGVAASPAAVPGAPTAYAGYPAQAYPTASWPGTSATATPGALGVASPTAGATAPVSVAAVPNPTGYASAPMGPVAVPSASEPTIGAAASSSAQPTAIATPFTFPSAETAASVSSAPGYPLGESLSSPVGNTTTAGLAGAYQAASGTPTGASFTHQVASSVTSAHPGLEAPPVGAMPASADPLIEAGSAVWYVRPASGGQYGPAGSEVMRQWLAENRIAGDTLVWREGWPNWKQAAEVFPQLNPATQLGPFAALGTEPTRSGASPTAGVGRVLAARRSNRTMQIALVVILLVAVIVLAVVFYVVLTSDSGQPAAGEGAKPPASAPAPPSRSPSAPGGGVRPPAGPPAGATTPAGPTAPTPPAATPTPPTPGSTAPVPSATHSGG